MSNFIQIYISLGEKTCTLSLSGFEPIFMFVVKHDVKVRCSVTRCTEFFKNKYTISNGAEVQFTALCYSAFQCLLSNTCMYIHNPSTCMYIHNPSTCMYIHNPSTCMYIHNPSTCVYIHNPSTCMYIHNPSTCMYIHNPSTCMYIHNPSTCIYITPAHVCTCIYITPAHVCTCIYITPALPSVSSHCYKPCGQPLTSFSYAGGRFGCWSQPDLLDKRVTPLSVAWL